MKTMFLSEIYKGKKDPNTNEYEVRVWNLSINSYTKPKTKHGVGICVCAIVVKL